MSEPPRPKRRDAVAGGDALEAGDHGDLAGQHPRLQLLDVDPGDAGGAMGCIGVQRNLPALPGARLDPHGLQHDGQQPRGDLLARGHHGVIFALVIMRRGRAAVVFLPLLEAPGLLDPGHELVGLAGHGRDHHGDGVAGVGLALHMRGDVADPVDVGDRRAAEFEHQQGHGLVQMRGAERPQTRRGPALIGPAGKSRVFHTD